MYDADNDVTRIFTQDSREKKRVGVGIHSRASRRGYCRGGVRTPSDFLTAKQKRLLNGEVKVYSMFEKYKDLNNCDLNEILKKSDNDIKNILATIKDSNSCSAICKVFKISNGKLYNFYKKYGVEYGQKPRSDIKGLEEKVISKEKFALMDTLNKGEYVTDVSENLGVSLSQLALFWKLQKSSLSYYKAQYLKKADKIKKPKEIVKQTKFPVENEVTEEVQAEIIEQPVNNINKEEELNKHIAELEKELELLRKNVVANVVGEHTGFRLNINGEYSKEDLGNRLLSIDDITITGRKYKVNLILEEA